MPTATQIIEQALGEIGSKAIGQAVGGSELLDCFDRLNGMVDAWRGQGLYAIGRATVTAVLPAGQASASIGVGQLFNVAPPSDLSLGAFYQLTGLDFEIRPISVSDYQAIPLKTQPGPGPTVMAYNAAPVVGTLLFWPIPAVSVTVTLTYPAHIGLFADLTTNYLFGAGYQRALVLSLAEELAAPYEAELSAMTVRNAKAARRILKRENAKIPVLRLDDRLPGVGFDIGVSRGLL